MPLTWLRPAYFYGAVFAFYASILLIPDAYDVFAAILVALCLVVVVWKRSWHFYQQDQWFALLLLAFPLSMLPSALLVGGHWSYFDYPVRALLFIPLIMGLRSFVDPGKFQSFLFAGSAAGGIGAALFSFISLIFNHFSRVGLPITNPISYGQIAAILALMSLAGFVTSSQLMQRIYFAFGVLGAVFSVYGSGSAGALLGLIAGIAVLLALMFKYLWLLNKWIFVFLLLAVVAFLYPLAAQKYVQALNEVKLTMIGHGMGTSQGDRLLMWAQALNSFLIHPWFGIGPGNISQALHEYCQSNYCTSGFAAHRGVHNQYLDVLMSGGLLGLLGWLVFSLGVAWQFFRRIAFERGQIASICGFSVVIAMMTSALTQGLYHHNISTIAFFFTITFLWFAATSAPGGASTELPGS